jgi:hypothetical protein
MNHALAHPHGLSLIDMERNLEYQGNPEYPIFQTGWSDFDKFNLRWWRVPAIEIGTTSTQAASR